MSLRKTLLCVSLAIAVVLFVGARPVTAQSWRLLQFDLDFSHAASRGVPLYMPQAAKPVPAIVILMNRPSAAAWIERYYAPQLARSGTAVLILKDFGAPTPTLLDAITRNDFRKREMNATLAAAQLKKDGRIASDEVLILSVSNVAEERINLTKMSMGQISVVSLALNSASNFACQEEFRWRWSDLDQNYCLFDQACLKPFRFLSTNCAKFTF